MFKSGEIHEAMASFEKSKNLLPYLGAGFDKEDREMWKSKSYYTNGKVNDFFIVFLLGWAGGKCFERFS